MKKNAILMMGLLLLVITHFGLAQESVPREGVAIRAVAANYVWPIDQDFLTKEFKAGMEVEYLRGINQFLDFSIPVRLGKAKLPRVESDRVFEEKAMISMDALLHLKYFNTSGFLYPHLFAGLSGIREGRDDFNFALPLGMGLNFRFAPNAYLSTKAEYRIGFKDLRDNLQLGGGLLFFIGGQEAEKPPVVSDRDGDGLPDAQDLCPDQAGLLALNGCPDRDGDGIADGEDQCPDLAGLTSLMGCPDADRDGLADKDDACPNEAGPVTNQGCPLRDADGDGIIDDNDACPNQPGPAATKGCPDADRDGLADKDDACPNEAGPAATKGCPDTDGDGIIDKSDKCPNTAGPASNNGCPEVKQEDKEILNLAMKAVQFETASANLLPVSYTILDQVVDIMRRYPDYRLRISGHTDSVGSSASNQTLSEKRAKACFDYLYSKGVSDSRMTWAGYGESRPIADNRYKAGRDQNRRVEFDLYLE